MLGSDGTATNAEMFRKQWQKMINHPGKARQRFKDEFDETVLTAGGVRFFCEIWTGMPISNSWIG